MMQKERLGDRRSDIRFEIIGQLWGSLETAEPLPLRNLSRGGALVESRLAFPSGSVQGVRLVFQDRASDLQVRVRHVTPIVDPELGERFLIGLEFVTAGEEALAHIDHLVAVSSGRGPNSVEA